MIDGEGIDNVIRRMGNSNAKVLIESMARDAQFRKAINTPLGKELLTGIVESLQSKLNLVIEEKADDKILAEVRVLRDLLGRWSDRISNADHDIMKFKKLQEKRR